VNKVATCVVLRHGPSRLLVRCEETRTQGANRVLARLRLAEKLESREKNRRAEMKQAAEKTKRQKRRPSKGARARNVENKRQRGETKRGRGRVKDF
jgi:protein subunit release factor B